MYRKKKGNLLAFIDFTLEKRFIQLKVSNIKNIIYTYNINWTMNDLLTDRSVDFFKSQLFHGSCRIAVGLTPFIWLKLLYCPYSILMVKKYLYGRGNGICPQLSQSLHKVLSLHSYSPQKNQTKLWIPKTKKHERTPLRWDSTCCLTCLFVLLL